MCPLFKEGVEQDPSNYRLVCLLSHVRKAIDTMVLGEINESYTPSMSQFGFQRGISVSQALFQSDSKDKKEMTYTAVLDLEKEYDKVDCKDLLEITKEWLSEDVYLMERAMLCKVYGLEKGQQTEYKALMTQGVPHGAPSSPRLIIMYIERLTSEVEATRSTVRAESATVMVTDNVLLQTVTQQGLQKLVDILTRCKHRRGASRFTFM